MEISKLSQLNLFLWSIKAKDMSVFIQFLQFFIAIIEVLEV